MKNEKIAFIALAAGFAAAAQSTPSVSGVSFSQNTLNRLVTVSYTLSGGPAVVTLDVQTNSVPGGGGEWVSIGGEAVSNATGDVWKKVSGDGARTILWRPDRSWPDHVVADGGARVVVTAWALDNPPDYMVVDISASAAPGTERYYPAVEFLPGGILENDAYRTTVIVMRKCLAKDVVWWMGSVSEAGRVAAKEAAHKACLDSNYYLGVFPVTQAQWALVQPSRANPSCFQYEADKAKRPVDNICYNEIRLSNSETTGYATYYWPNDPHPNSFLGRLRSKTGIEFDLPGEAQWEFAARAGNGEGKWGDGSAYLSTSTDANLSALACYGRANIQNSVSEGNTTVTAADGGTMPVGSFSPNAWGFYDMYGNVFEPCLDWFEEDVSGRGGAVNIDQTAPANALSGTAGSYRVWRGGSYRHSAANCRPAYRAECIANGRYNIAGVRVACPATAE